MPITQAQLPKRSPGPRDCIGALHDIGALAHMAGHKVERFETA
jgi:hypothetical protein